MTVPAQRRTPATRSLHVPDSAALCELVPVAAAEGWHVVAVVREERDLRVQLTR